MWIGKSMVHIHDSVWNVCKLCTTGVGKRIFGFLYFSEWFWVCKAKISSERFTYEISNLTVCVNGKTLKRCLCMRVGTPRYGLCAARYMWGIIFPFWAMRKDQWKPSVVITLQNYSITCKKLLRTVHFQYFFSYFRQQFRTLCWNITKINLHLQNMN